MFSIYAEPAASAEIAVHFCCGEGDASPAGARTAPEMQQPAVTVPAGMRVLAGVLFVNNVAFLQNLILLLSFIPWILQMESRC
jgi:hypothetical protein